MGSERLLDVMPDFFKSPIVTEFRWFPLIEGTLHQNLEHFAPDGLPHSSPDNDPYPIIEGLLVRRGDFDHHCEYLAKRNKTFTAFNQIQGITDRFKVPPRGPKGHFTDEGARSYQKAYYQALQDIIQRLGEIRELLRRKGVEEHLHHGERETRVGRRAEGSFPCGRPLG